MVGVEYVNTYAVGTDVENVHHPSPAIWQEVSNV